MKISLNCIAIICVYIVASNGICNGKLRVFSFIDLILIAFSLKYHFVLFLVIRRRLSGE